MIGTDMSTSSGWPTATDEARLDVLRGWPHEPGDRMPQATYEDDEQEEDDDAGRD